MIFTDKEYQHELQRYRNEVLLMLRSAGYEALAEAEGLAEFLDDLIQDIAYFTLHNRPHGVEYTLSRMNLLRTRVQIEMEEKAVSFLTTLLSSTSTLAMALIRSALSAAMGGV